MRPSLNFIYLLDSQTSDLSSSPSAANFSKSDEHEMDSGLAANDTEAFKDAKVSKQRMNNNKFRKIDYMFFCKTI